MGNKQTTSVTNHNARYFGFSVIRDVPTSKEYKIFLCLINGREVRSAPVRNQSKITRLFRAELQILDQHPIRTALTKRPMSAAHANCFSSSWRTELEISTIQSEQQHQRDNLRLAYLHSCPPSARTAKIALRGSDSFRPENQKKLMH